MLLTKRVTLINPSPTLAITAKANKMKAEGINVIGFGAGEPDFDTPDNIKESAKKALDKGMTKYTPTSGTIDLKKSICKKLKQDNNLDYSTDQIIVSCGAKHSIYNIIMTLCDDGDEVLIPSPYWVSYPEMVRVSGGTPVFINTSIETGFKITPRQLKEHITKKTKLFILNSPSNPTGMVYSEQELKQISDILCSHKIYCISDEIYEKIMYDNNKHTSIASFNDTIKNLTLVVNGVSKSYSMTGWRIGYAAGPREIIQAMSNLQDHSTSNPTSIAQVATIEALDGPQSELNKMLAAFTQRREFIVNSINKITGLHCIKPEGAFYVFVNISGILNKKINNILIDSSMKLTEILLEHAKVAVVPGGVFGNDNYIRLSYATSMENIKEGLNRIDQFLNQNEK